MGTVLRRRPSYPIGDITWWSIGIGYYPVTAGASPYDQAYFDRFARQASTEIGYQLMSSRVKFVERHYRGSLVDVGIGSGAFIAMRSCVDRTLGWDVNPAGLNWLRDRDLAFDPNKAPCQAASMWDVMEHIEDFGQLLANVDRWLFLSLPIFRDAAHVLGSKHFRPDEHFWYFTRSGLTWLMERFGFRLMEENYDETLIGREDIGSFAFHKGAG